MRHLPACTPPLTVRVVGDRPVLVAFCLPFLKGLNNLNLRDAVHIPQQASPR